MKKYIARRNIIEKSLEKLSSVVDLSSCFFLKDVTIITLTNATVTIKNFTTITITTVTTAYITSVLILLSLL